MPEPGTADPGDLDVIVSAAGLGGLVDSVGVTDLEIVGGSGSDEPWLRFGLVLNHCCSEPNSVVFAPEQWTADVGSPAQLRLVGPACEGAVTCSDAERRVALNPTGPTAVPFEVFRDADDLAPVSVGTLSTVIEPTFEYDAAALDSEPLPITLRFDVTAAVPDPSGDTTPTATPALPVETVGGGFDLLQYPLIAVADDEAALAAILTASFEPVDAAALGIDWATHAALVVAIGTNLCPPVLVGIAVDGSRATPVFVNAGYTICEDPLLSHSVIAAVDRATLAGVTEVVLPADLGFSEQATVAAVSVAAPTGAVSVEPTVVEFGERVGSVPLPARGEVVATVIDSGAPVYVVRHHDGTVSALDPRGAAGTDGLYGIAGWVAATRNFLGGGAWDEYGRRLDGFRSTDLAGYATRVVDDKVEIGSSVDPPAGSPVTQTTDPPAMADVRVVPEPLIAVEEAVTRPVGSTAWISGEVIAHPDGAHLCAASAIAGAPASEEPLPSPRCADGSPVVDGIVSEPGTYNAYFGPILATRTDEGFHRVAAAGGYGGGMIYDP